jgi:DNA replication protein DnaC
MRPNQLLDILERKSKKDFQFDEWNKEVIKKLCHYFCNSDKFETMGEGYSLEKGIMLYGPVGCGKTYLMELLRNNPKQVFTIIPCDDIATDFFTKGDSAIYNYIKFANKDKNILSGRCYDDLGTEQAKNHFGNHIDALTKVILKRYFMRSPYYSTHITTNITAPEIEDRYGIRIRDRFREMFNLIKFSDEAPSRRK